MKRIKNFIKDWVFSVSVRLINKNLSLFIKNFDKNYLHAKASYSQQGEDLIIQRLISHTVKIDKKFYVDIGGFHPIAFSDTYLLYQNGWRGYVFDWSITLANDYKKYRPRDKYFSKIIGANNNADQEFYVSKYRNYSLIDTKYPSADEMQLLKKTRVIQVNLNDELKKLKIKKIGFLKIDAQNADEEIIESFDFQTFRPNLISVEILGNNLEEWMKSKIYKILIKNDYVLVSAAPISIFFACKKSLKK